MSTHDLSSYKNLFLETASEYQTQLHDTLLVLEKEKNDVDTRTHALIKAHLCAHSLKSECFAMGYTKLGTLCKTIEFLFYDIKEGKIALTEKLLLELRDASLQIAKELSAIEANGSDSVVLDQSDLGVSTRQLEAYLPK